MKRILLAFAILAFAATSSPAAPQPGLPSSKQPVMVSKPYQQPVPSPAARLQPAPGVKSYHQPAQAPGYHHPAPAVRPHHQPPQPPIHHHAVLHGNVMSKVYHARDCDYYNSKGAKTSFASAREAERAGFRACKICEGKEGVATGKKQNKASAAQLRGNPDSKTLHGPSCKFYNSKGSTETFSSVEQAKKQGYHLCTVCEGK